MNSKSFPDGSYTIWLWIIFLIHLIHLSYVVHVTIHFIEMLSLKLKIYSLREEGVIKCYSIFSIFLYILKLSTDCYGSAHGMVRVVLGILLRVFSFFLKRVYPTQFFVLQKNAHVRYIRRGVIAQVSDTLNPTPFPTIPDSSLKSIYLLICGLPPPPMCVLPKCRC